MADLFSNAVPIAADADPASSHAAGDRHTRSGMRDKNCRRVLALVERNQGATSVELFAAQGLGGNLSREEVSRRLADLKNAGLVVQGRPRLCSIKRTKMVTWCLNK